MNPNNPGDRQTLPMQVNTVIRNHPKHKTILKVSMADHDLIDLLFKNHIR